MGKRVFECKITRYHSVLIASEDSRLIGSVAASIRYAGFIIGRDFFLYCTVIDWTNIVEMQSGIVDHCSYY